MDMAGERPRERDGGRETAGRRRSERDGGRETGNRWEVNETFRKAFPQSSPLLLRYEEKVVEEEEVEGGELESEAEEGRSLGQLLQLSSFLQPAGGGDEGEGLTGTRDRGLVTHRSIVHVPHLHCFRGQWRSD